MAVAVWKFALRVDGEEHRLALPAGAQVLHVGQQSPREVCFWVLVRPDAEKDVRRFRVFATGETVPEDDGVLPRFVWHYHGTSTGTDGLPFVWHLFERLGAERYAHSARSSSIAP